METARVFFFFTVFIGIIVLNTESLCTLSHTRCTKLSSTFLKCNFPGMCVKIPPYIKRVECGKGTTIEVAGDVELRNCEVRTDEEEEKEEEGKALEPQNLHPVLPTRGNRVVVPVKENECPPLAATTTFMDVLDKLLSCLGGVVLTLLIWYCKRRMRPRTSRRHPETPVDTPVSDNFRMLRYPSESTNSRMLRCVSTPNVRV